MCLNSAIYFLIQTYKTFKQSGVRFLRVLTIALFSRDAIHPCLMTQIDTNSELLQVYEKELKLFKPSVLSANCVWRYLLSNYSTTNDY